MGWIGDVIPRTTIRSVWGNALRNQLVQIFEASGDWDRAPVQQEGMLGWSKVDRAFVYRGADHWHWLYDALPPYPVVPTQPQLLTGTPVVPGAGQITGNGTTLRAATVNIPPGFSHAFVSFQLLVGTNASAISCEVAAYLGSNGARQGFSRIVNSPTPWLTMSLHTTTGVSPAGDFIAVDLTNTRAADPGRTEYIQAFNDPQVTILSATAYP